MSEPDTDGARDAWLSQALRHAPDSNAAPPPTLSEAILAKARAAAAPPSPLPPTRARVAGRTLGDVLGTWWLALARPPVAAAFASVMAATIVGLMWWDRPMDERVPRPSPVAADPVAAAPAPSLAAVPAPTPTPTPAPTPAPTPTPTPTPAPAPAPASNDQATTALTQSKLQSAAPTERVAQSAAARKSEGPAAFPPSYKQRDGSSPRLDEAKKDAVPSSFAAAATPPVRQAESARAAGALSTAPAATTAPVEAAPTRSPEPAPATAPAPAAAPATATPLDAGRTAGQARSGAAADRSDKAMAKSVAPGREPGPAANATPRRRQVTDERETADALERDKSADAAAPETSARAGAPDPRSERPAIVSSPLTPLLEAIARDPLRWTRQTAAGDTAALEPERRDWLAGVDAAAAGRWQASGPRPADLENQRREGATLRLFLDGRAAAIVRFEGQTVRLDAPLGAATEHWQASLTPAAAARLETGRARLSP